VTAPRHAHAPWEERPGPGVVQYKRPPDPIMGCYRALTYPFDVRSERPEIGRAVDFVYREMRRPGADAARLEIEIGGPSRSGWLDLRFGGTRVFRSSRKGDILHALDNELSIVIGGSRPDLYFVHGAVFSLQGKAILLAGESGAGKSTISYALASVGLEYLSDELAGIDPRTGLVHPYPRAICLKKDPPAPLKLPLSEHLRTEWTLHVAARDLSAPIARSPSKLERIFFIQYLPSHATPRVRPLTQGAAALRLYQNALNQLAHPEAGLDTTLELVKRARCYELLSAGIDETVNAVLNPDD